MQLLFGTLLILLSGLVILAPTFRTTDQPIKELLDSHRQHWPGEVSDLEECPHYRQFEYVTRYECQLSDHAQYISDGDTILSLRLTPGDIRLGDGIVAYGPPDTYIRNDQFHFMRWELPPVTLVARHVQGNWLMGPVDEVYLRG